MKEHRTRIWFPISGGIAAISLCLCSYLEKITPFQPDAATGRVHELPFKSGPHYFTGPEALMFLTSLLVLIVSTLVFAKLKQEVDEEKRKERQALENGNMLGLRL
jgi:hypothetical protein